MTDAEFFSVALGVGTRNRDGEWLEVYYPQPLFQPEPSLVEAIGTAVGYQGGNRFIEVDRDALSKLMPLLDDQRQQTILTAMAASDQPRVITFIEEDRELSSTPETYLKLHLLSHRFVRPNQQNLEGIYALLPNVAWTDRGAIDLDELFEIQLAARMRGEVVEVASVDKFPKMTNYVVPSGVRIAHSARVRLGAYLGDGTTVMHEGFVNFNAAAIGPGMIEGRISQGVTIEAGSDLGGSASTAGTLSGGGNIVLTIGKDCLISANAGTGIPLGDRCTIEAGLYVTPGTLVQVIDEDKNPVKVVKARELAGQSDMLFIRNSQTGIVECRINKKAISLNEALHAHN
jgi:2,3,4,5-tetrahydropyridine-2-carboxylate N-succinyltransferase